MPEGSGDALLGALRAGITTPFIAMSFAWYSATASRVDCVSQCSVDGGDSSALLISGGNIVEL